MSPTAELPPAHPTIDPMAMRHRTGPETWQIGSSIFFEPIGQARSYITSVVALVRHPVVAVAGEEMDFEAFYTLHARWVAGVVHRIMGADGEVDDIVQDTFIDAIDGLAALENPAAVRAWLVTVAVRRAKRVLAKRRRRSIFAFWVLDYAPQASDPRDREPVDELYDALSRIPGDLRIPWVLHRVESLSLPECARVCEVSLATVKRRISECEERIDRRLGGSK